MSAEQSSTRTPSHRTPSRFRPDRPLIAGGLDWSWAFVVYRPTSGYPDYLLGSDGTVWSIQRRGKTKAPQPWTQVYPAPNVVTGHLTFGFRRHGQGKRISIHRLVLETFLGPCPPGRECCHNDGQSWNNRIGNLRWDTSKGNSADRDRHGRQPRREAHYRAKLTSADVAAIRRLIERAIPHKTIAPLFGLAESTVGQIGRNERWRE